VIEMGDKSPKKREKKKKDGKKIIVPKSSMPSADKSK